MAVRRRRIDDDLVDILESPPSTTNVRRRRRWSDHQRKWALLAMLLVVLVCVVLVLSRNSFLSSKLIPTRAFVQNNTTSTSESPSRMTVSVSGPNVPQGNGDQQQTNASTTQRHDFWDTHGMYNCTMSSGKQVTLPKIPTFIIIGVQKAGTTAMHELIQKHPLVIPPRSMDEAHFFDFHGERLMARIPFKHGRNLCDARHEYATNYFQSDLMLQNTSLFAFEKTPSYVSSPLAPYVMNKIVPWAKLILILRNPVDRLFSQYRMDHLRYGQKAVTLEHWLAWEVRHLSEKFHFPESNPLPMNSSDVEQIWSPADESKSILYRGLYAILLKKWFKYYKREDILILRSEVMRENTQQALDQIFEFVGLPPFSYDAASLSKPYRSSELDTNANVRLNNITAEFLRAFYEPHNNDLADLLGEEEWRSVWR